MRSKFSASSRFPSLLPTARGIEVYLRVRHPVYNPLLPKLFYNFENGFPSNCTVAPRTFAHGRMLSACRCIHAPFGTCCFVRHSEKSCFEACLRSQHFFALCYPARRSPTLL